MKKVFTLIILSFTAYCGMSQLADFEDFGLATGTFDNDSSPEAWFETEDLRFPNDYNSEFDFWTGWAISTDTDTQTPGFMNQYSSISGAGGAGSDTYAVSFVSGKSFILFPENSTIRVNSLQINNATYPYLSMRDGDSFAKKFGGETGDDPDFFLLTIKGYEGGALVDSVLFYLADYRFEDNSQDYIVDEWTTVDLPVGFGAQDSLVFSLSSSDNGMFGMNTPAYFCADNLQISNTVSTIDNTLSGISLVNTLVDEVLIIDSDLEGVSEYEIFNVHGQQVWSGRLGFGEEQVHLGFLPGGQYWMNIRKGSLQWTGSFLRR